MDLSFQEISMEEKDLHKVKEDLNRKIIAFYTDIWSDIRNKKYERWLENFDKSDEKLNALYLLSKFTYFGNNEIRAMLKSVFRDLYKYPIVAQIRKSNADTIDETFIKREFKKKLNHTRFLGVGNPSESGVHLLYYFRQENELSKNYFFNANELFLSSISQGNGELTQSWRDDNISHVVFIDDFCGNGYQAISYIKEIVEQIKSLKNECIVEYFVLVAKEEGLRNVRKQIKVDRADAIFVLDDSFKCFSGNSRYFTGAKIGIDKKLCKAMCEKYGNNRWKDAQSAMGYNNDELLISFFHNTPSNTLPIFWTDAKNWYPIFNRDIKIYR